MRIQEVTFQTKYQPNFLENQPFRLDFIRQPNSFKKNIIRQKKNDCMWSVYYCVRRQYFFSSFLKFVFRFLNSF